jgi:non-homologous end joining protein Ku
MSRSERERVAAFEARHAAIIARTLRWADEAAARRDYVRAVHWIEAVRRLGDALPDEYEAKRETWVNAIDRDRRHRD